MGRLALVSATIMAMSFASAATAAEIRLLGSPGVRGVVEALAPKFQGKTGHTIAGDFEVVAKIKKRIDDGERFDIAVLSPEALATLIADKKVDGQVPFARAGMGIGFRKGAAKPDVSSADAIRKTLLAARSVVYSAQGLSGQAYLALVGRLGIATEMKDKAKSDDGNILQPVACRRRRAGRHLDVDDCAQHGCRAGGPVSGRASAVRGVQRGRFIASRAEGAARGISGFSEEALRPRRCLRRRDCMER